MQRVWRIAETTPPDCPALFGVHHPVVASLLWQRGMRTREEAEIFFDPQWETHTHDHAQFRQMAGAVERTYRALQHGERITVHGDYDADGITGSAVIITALQEIEKRVIPDASGFTFQDSRIDFYIPHREKEGYGLHRETVRQLKERGTRLLITVDCGIACVDEIAFAKEEGMDTIVVDHHQFGEILPDGWLIHPSIPQETYPFKKLAAVGVAYKFACALLDEARSRGLAIPTGWEKWLLDLVAIATVTDMVPLIGENRVLLRYGLHVLNKTRRMGLRALLRIAGTEGGEWNEETIGFTIGPRLNAAGRMDHAELALRLLLSDSPDETDALARDLERCNRERQAATKRMVAEAETMISESGSDPSVLLVLWQNTWSPSLVGLVAGKFLERFGVPSIVIGCHEGKWIGSGRATNGFDITTAVRTAGDGLLKRVGGHPQACGFTLDDENMLQEFAVRLRAYANAILADKSVLPMLMIDAEMPLDLLDWSLMESLKRFAPFGEGNRRPVFATRGCYVTRAQTVGANKDHLRLQALSSNGKHFSCIGFRMGDRLSETPVGSFIDMAYEAEVNVWNGQKEIQCRLIDIRKGET